MTDRERGLFMILVEHDVLVDTRRQVGPLYVRCPVCNAEPGSLCPPDAPGEASGPYHDARRELRQRTLPDLSDIHTTTRQRIRDLFERGIYPEDLLTDEVEADHAAR